MREYSSVLFGVETTGSAQRSQREQAGSSVDRCGAECCQTLCQPAATRWHGTIAANVEQVFNMRPTMRTRALGTTSVACKRQWLTSLMRWLNICTKHLFSIASEKSSVLSCTRIHVYANNGNLRLCSFLWPTRPQLGQWSIREMHCWSGFGSTASMLKARERRPTRRRTYNADRIINNLALFLIILTSQLNIQPILCSMPTYVKQRVHTTTRLAHLLHSPISIDKNILLTENPMRTPLISFAAYFPLSTTQRGPVAANRILATR